MMVFFYGGGFVMGSTCEAFYGVDFLMQKDIVLVTINYRVGAFGKKYLSNKILLKYFL